MIITFFLQSLFCSEAQTPENAKNPSIGEKEQQGALPQLMLPSAGNPGDIGTTQDSDRSDGSWALPGGVPNTQLLTPAESTPRSDETSPGKQDEIKELLMTLVGRVDVLTNQMKQLQQQISNIPEAGLSEQNEKSQKENTEKTQNSASFIESFIPKQEFLKYTAYFGAVVFTSMLLQKYGKIL